MHFCKPGQVKEAYGKVQRLLDRYGKNADLWLLKAEIEKSLNLFEDASLSLIEASRYAPEDNTIPGTLGVALFEAGKYKEALKYLEKALSRDSKNGELWKRKAAALEILRNYSLAAEAYQQAALYLPDDPQ